MDGVKYYELQEDQTYCIHFANKRGLSIPEIELLFSSWGNVVKVTKAGDDFGYRFVRYRTEEEVLRCLEGLKHHAFIKALPKVPKDHRKSQRSSNDQPKNNHSNEDTGNELWNENPPPPVLGFAEKCRAQSRLYTIGRTTDDIQRFDGFAKKVSPTNSIRNFEQKSPILNGNWLKTVQMNNTAACQPLMSLQLPLTPPTNMELVTPTFTNVSPGLTPLTTENHKEIKQEEQQPKPNRSGINENTVESHEIVFANIPPSYGVHYILHLLEKFEPISVDPMKVIQPQGIRFCIVFLASAQLAAAVESNFDNREMDGKKLIVLRPSSLKNIAINA